LGENRSFFPDDRKPPKTKILPMATAKLDVLGSRKIAKKLIDRKRYDRVCNSNTQEDYIISFLPLRLSLSNIFKYNEGIKHQNSSHMLCMRWRVKLLLVN
jgi:hypothetical protein